MRLPIPDKKYVFLYLFLIYIGYLSILITSCGTKKSSTNLLVKPPLVYFVDSSEASVSIIHDDIDGFFDQISMLDIEIQLKKEVPYSNRNTALTDYKKYLQTQVSPWKEEEKESVLNIFTKAKNLCDTINPRIFPGGIRLIKIKTNHYGNHVYYTRGNNILIPENIFPISDESTQLPVMLHEIFHLLSRNNENLKHDLYKLIGFTKSDSKIMLDDNVAKRTLTNPDGVSYQYFMDLDSTKAIPLITSKFLTYKKSSPSFFDYLNFDLYSITKKDGRYITLSSDNGESTLALQKTPIFFTKIKDNTQYIIHPDEIMADNFMLTILAYSSGNYNKYSPEGKILLEQVLSRLKVM